MDVISKLGHLVAFLMLPLVAYGQSDALRQEATWQLVSDDQLSDRLRDALTDEGLPAKTIAQAIQQWDARLAQSQSDRLDDFIAQASEVLPKLKAVVSSVEQSPSAIGDDPFLGFSSGIRNQARLWAGRELVRSRLYDEAVPLLQSLEPSDVIAPTDLLFYRGACYHGLLRKDEAIEDLTTLLQRVDDIPRRFARTAELMLADIEPLKEDSLDEIARMMNDVSRRLDLGRADEPVVDREQEIIDKLDKMIDKMEEEHKKRQQQQQASQGGGGGKGGESMPLQESQIAGGRGPGDVDKKSLGEADGWGNLPAAQRQEALQKISQDLPTHYREAIEAYFRKLATEQR